MFSLYKQIIEWELSRVRGRGEKGLLFNRYRISSFPVQKVLEIHNNANILNTTELHTFKMVMMLNFVMCAFFITIF